MHAPSLFQSTVARLKSQLARGASARTYEEARARHCALLPYASPAEALSALAPSSSLTLPERDVVVSALVAECQLSKNPLWQTLLLLAFEPMLYRLRSKIGSTPSDDFDQRVLVAFYGALAVVRPGPVLALVIRRATERQLFPSLKVARRESRNELFDEETHPADLLALDAATEAAEVIRIVEAKGGAELREAILATRATDETLLEYVARTHPNATPAERSAAYDRLWVARNAVERRLRESRKSERGASAADAASAASAA